MSRNKDYQRLLNSKRWKELRAWKMRQNPLCEMCAKVGKVSASVDIHHITPVETAKTVEGMERLAYDPDNLMALCIPCHIKVHTEMGMNTKANRKKRQEDAFERWKKKHDGYPRGC